MGHRFSKLTVVSNSKLITSGNSTVDSLSLRNPNAAAAASNSNSNRIPIPLPTTNTTTTINVQIQESPTSIDAASAVATTASSNNRLSDSDSSSLASLTATSLQNRQIIIKIQLAKMENGNESQQEQLEICEASPSSLSSLSHDTNSLESNFSQNPSTQFVNLTVNGNIYYTNEGTTNELASLSSNCSQNSRNTGAAVATSSGVYTKLNNNANCNRNGSGSGSSIELNLNTLHIREDWEQQQQQQANDNLPEYCEVLENSSLNSSFQPTNDEINRLDANSTETFGCLNTRRKSKTSSSRPTSASSSSSISSGMSTKRRCRDALRRILEPTTKLTNNKNKEINNKKQNDSNHSTSTSAQQKRSSLPPPTLPSCSKTVLPSTSGLRNQQTTTQSLNINQNQQQQLTTTTTSNNLMPISITTVGGASTSTSSPATTNSTVTTTNNNQLPTAIWTSTNRTNDLIIPITSPPQFVVLQCAPTSVVTLGRTDDNNAIRLTSTEVGTVNCFNVSNVNGNGNGTFNATLSPPQPPTTTRSLSNGPIVHSQVDFVHCLVPDLVKIVNSSFYWGKIDRYEAERLLEGKPEGTFLLRDSAQEEYLFSVTFRKYNRSLHARIEQSGHRFGFDCHDPGVFTAPTVTGLLQHYKDPTSVMFFEPTLTIPLHRKTVFSLQELARAAIVSNTTYDGINELGLPVRVKSFLKEYHYKQKLRVKPCDEPFYACT